MVTASFILTTLLIVLIPGTGVLYTVSAGITGSRQDSITAAIGCTLGIIPHLTAGILGISAILHTSAMIFLVIKYVGVVYLIYLGITMIRDKSGIDIKEEYQGEKKTKIIGKAILMNLLNPKLTLFFFSFIPQFITDGNRSYIFQMLLLSVIFMGLTLVVFILYGILANYFKQHFISSPRTVRRFKKGAGWLFIGLAAKLAIIDS